MNNLLFVLFIVVIVILSYACCSNKLSNIKNGGYSNTEQLITNSKLLLDKSNTMKDFIRNINNDKDFKKMNKHKKNKSSSKVKFLPIKQVRLFDKETREIVGNDRIMKM